MKKLLITISIVLVTMCLNFAVFLYAYKKLAFPYLHEAQRVDNAPFIFSYILAGFLLVSIVSFIFTRYLARMKT